VSEMFASTGEKRSAVCVVCGGTVIERELHGIAGSVVWDSMPHSAPCGLPCIGGGVSVQIYRTGAVHKTDSCPRKCKP